MINTVELKIWERLFSLDVEYDCYEDETITVAQQDAIARLISHPEWIKNAKDVAESYCREQVIADSENAKKDNIFSYLKPKSIFVKREKQPRVAIMCKYRYDPEHGLAIVFSADGRVSVGSQDIIL